MDDGLDQAAQTAAEHAAASAAEPGGRARARPSRPAVLSRDTPDDACANCATPLEGPVCHRCGQLDDEFHRPVRGLVGEILEGLVAFDGRVARTIPALIAQPGKITRAFLKGKRARYMPPFRLYIIASLIFFLVMPALDSAFDGAEFGGSPSVSQDAVSQNLEEAVADGDLSEEEAERARETLRRFGLIPEAPEAGAEADLDPAVPETADSAAPEDVGEAPDRFIAPQFRGPPIDVDLGGETVSTPDSIRRFFAPEDFNQPAPETIWPLPVRRYIGDRIAEAQADPRSWLERAANWVPRIMFVMVPVYALLLALVYAWRRGFFFYDHLMVSLHLHSALFLTSAVVLQLSGLIGAGWAWLAMIVYSNVYLYKLHRVVYVRGRISSVLRTMTLDVLYFFVLSFGMIAVLLLGALA